MLRIFQEAWKLPVLFFLPVLLGALMARILIVDDLPLNLDFLEE
jgi:hypothetical protein